MLTSRHHLGWSLVAALVVLGGAPHAAAQAPTRLFFENFDSLTLRPNLDEGFADPTAYTHTPPAGWSIDNTELNASIPATRPGIGGQVIPVGVREWRGWSFADFDFWYSVDNQQRSDFVRASGNVAVADPDEFDDLADPLNGNSPNDARYKTKLSMPAVNIASVPAGHNLYVSFDSSFKGETADEYPTGWDTAVSGRFNPFENQTALVVANSVELLRWESSPVLEDFSPNPDYRPGASTGDPNNAFTGASLSERVTLTVPRSQIAGNSLNLSFTLQDALNDWWWAIDNVSVYAGLEAPAAEQGLKLVIDRETGNGIIENNSGFAVDIRGYSIGSKDGSLVESAYTPLADVPGSGWVTFSDPGSNRDLSEGKVSGALTISNGQQISLGGIWKQWYDEAGDLSFEYLDSTGSLLNGPVEFVGNGGSAFPFGDLDFDGDVDVADWTEFKNGIPANLAGLTSPDLYQNSDLNLDGKQNLFDVIAFRQAYDAFNGAGAFLALSTASVPEPASALLVVGLLAVAAVCRGRSLLASQNLLALIVSLALVTTAQAVVLLEENFDSVPLGTTVERAPGTENAWTKTPPTGWAVDDSQMPGVYGGADDGVREFYGWNFMSADFFRAPDQNRSLFTLGTGGVAVADPDEWDDAANPDQLYNTFLRSPTVAIPANIGLIVSFDSSWRPEGFDDLGGINNQTATVRAIYNVGGSEVVREVIRWDSDPGSLFYHNDADDDESLTGLPPGYITENEQVLASTAPPVGATSVQFEFGLTEAYNDWWWAIDNVKVETFAPVVVQVDTSTGNISVLGTADNAINREMFAYSLTSESGSLNPVGWAAGNLDAQNIGGGTGGDVADYNGDSVVDAADYTVWRDGGLAADGSGAVVGTPDGVVNGADYSYWAATFGLAGSGGPGSSWETVITDPSELVESWLLGSTLLDESVLLTLGSAFQVGGEQDLKFTYTNAAGVQSEALVVYLSSATVLSSSAVPEPFTILPGVIGMLAFALTTRWNRTRTVAAMVMLAAVVLTGTSHAAYTLDRDYRFGENDSAAFGPVVPNGTLRVGGNGVGDANDSAGIPNAQGGSNQVITLVPLSSGASAGPLYVNVSGERPFASPGEIAVQFTASTGANTLKAEPLGSPGESVSSSTASSSLYAGGVGPFDYEGVTNRGFQFWVKPTVVNTSQVIVQDTNQHAVGISSNGRWFMQYAQGAGGVTSDRTIDTTVPESQAVAGQWYHVMMVRPYGAARKIEDPIDPGAALTFDSDVSNGPNGGSRMYVNGVAVAADGGGYSTALSYNAGTASFLGNSILWVGGRGTTNSSGTLTGVAEAFRGTLDDLEMFVVGTSFKGTQFGDFNVSTDNHFIRNTLNGVGLADLNRDGQENQLDVSAFVDGWKSQNLVNGLLVGDLRSRSRGDVNFDGVVDLADWFRINQASPVLSGSIAVALGFAPAAVPEPATYAAALAGLAALALYRQRR